GVKRGPRSREGRRCARRRRRPGPTDRIASRPWPSRLRPPRIRPAQASDLRRSLELEDGLPRDRDRIAELLAEELTPPRGAPERPHRGLPEPPRPVRDELAMRRARRRILGDAGGGGEEARDEVARCPARRRDDAERVHAREDAEVRPQ